MKNNVDILVGGQFGSEGKGKFAAYLSKQFNYDFSVRSGGPNAGHTFYVNEKKYITRHIPCAAANRSTKLFLSPSTLVNHRIFQEELSSLKSLNVLERIYIDNLVGVISQKHIDTTNPDRASTAQGVGSAQAEKATRNLPVARDDSRFNLIKKVDVINEINTLIDNHNVGLLEGTQGTGLSLSNYWYPYCTSRDVYASSMLSDCGLSPLVVRDIYLVIRTYPIRFGGNSGPMGEKELSWDEIRNRSGNPNLKIEMTTMGNIPRRISEFSWNEAKRAVSINRPTMICLSFVDYINHEDYGVREKRNLSKKARRFIDTIEDELKVPVALISTGPLEHHTIEWT